MTINDNQWCGTSDTSDTSHTANSSDASKASVSVTRHLSYLLLPLCYIYGKQCWPISFNQFSNNRNFCRRWFLVTPHKEATKTIGIFKAHLGLQMSLHIICFIAFLYVFSAKNGYQKKSISVFVTTHCVKRAYHHFCPTKCWSVLISIKIHFDIWVFFLCP